MACFGVFLEQEFWYWAGEFSSSRTGFPGGPDRHVIFYILMYVNLNASDVLYTVSYVMKQQVW